MCLWYAVVLCLFFFFKQKTAYEMRISDWSSDVCSSDLRHDLGDDALVAVTSGHLVARLQLALHRDEHLDHLHDARRQLVAALQLLDLVIETGLKLLDRLVELLLQGLQLVVVDRKSTRLNSSH